MDSSSCSSFSKDCRSSFHKKKSKKERCKEISHPLVQTDTAAASLHTLKKEGLHHFSSQHWKEAVDKLAEAHFKEPDNEEIHLKLATARRNFFLLTSSVHKPSKKKLHKFVEQTGIELDIQNLVFQGGGIKGAAYVGALEELEKWVDLHRIERVGGSSAGGMTSLLLALGFTVPEIMDEVRNLELNLMMDGPFAETLMVIQQQREVFLKYASSIVGDLKELKQSSKAKIVGFVARKMLRMETPPYTDEFKSAFTILGKEYGLFPGDFFREALVEKVLQERTGIPYITFRELHEIKEKFPERGFKDVYFTGSDIYSRRIKIFSWEHTPDVIVSDALRISISLPLIWAPHHEYSKIGGRRVQGPSPSLFVDGGVLENYPIWLFDKSKYLPSSNLPPENHVVNPYTLGFRLVNQESSNLLDMYQPFPEDGEKVSNFPQYLWKLVMMLALRDESEHYTRPQDRKRTVYIYDLGVLITELNIEPSRLEELIENGRKAFRTYAEKRILERRKEKFVNVLSLPQKNPEYVYSAFSTFGEKAKGLLESGSVSINEVDRDGNSALHFAAFYDDDKVVKALLSEGADAQLRNNRGRTPLEVAFAAKSKKAAGTLAQHDEQWETKRTELKKKEKIPEKEPTETISMESGPAPIYVFEFDVPTRK